MYRVSQNYLDYINNDNILGRTVKNKIVIDDEEYFSDSLKTNPKISHTATSFIGGFYSKSCEFEILNLEGSLVLNDTEVTVYKGLEFNGSTEWVPMGIFKATDPNITNNESTKSIKFLGYDRAVLFDTTYTSSLDWTTSHTGLEIVQEVCTNVGVTLETTDFAFATYEFTSEPNFLEDTLNREVIGRMAEIGGEIAYISRDGGLIITGQNTTGQTVGQRKRISLTKEPIFGPINTVALGKADVEDDVIYPETITEDRITWRIEDNPYVDLIREEIIEDVAENIIGMSITPFTINGFIDDFIYDLNDVISVIDNSGNTFNAVMLNYATENRMRSNVGAEAQTEKTINHEIAGSTKQTLNRVSLQVNHNTQQIQLLATSVSDLEESTTEILQTAEQIVMTALQDYVTTGDFETYQTTVSTQFQQTAEDFNFIFNNITQQLNDLDADTQEQFQEITKYIRFVNGNIVLGQVGNELTLNIANDRISFLQNDSEVAYFSNNKLYVTDGEFLNSLIIGNFAWKPRANGNLSLVYIGSDTN